MKWFDNLIRKTNCYKRLYRELGICKQEYEKLEFMYKEQYNYLFTKTKQLEKDKTSARQIIRLTNKTFQDKDTKNQIQNLCHKIIKGEK